MDLRDLVRIIAFIGAVAYLIATLRVKPWKDDARWRTWLMNTALLFVIAAAFTFVVPSCDVSGRPRSRMSP